MSRSRSKAYTCLWPRPAHLHLLSLWTFLFCGMDLIKKSLHETDQVVHFDVTLAQFTSTMFTLDVANHFVFKLSQMNARVAMLEVTFLNSNRVLLRLQEPRMGAGQGLSCYAFSLRVSLILIRHHLIVHACDQTSCDCTSLFELAFSLRNGSVLAVI